MKKQMITDFINDNSKSLDDLFQDVDSLIEDFEKTPIDDKKETLFEDNTFLPQIDKIKNEILLNEDVIKKQLTPQEELKLREQQLEISKRLSEDAQHNLGNMNNKETLLSAAQNSKQYMLNNTKTSLQVMPRELRHQVATDKSLSIDSSNNPNQDSVPPQQIPQQVMNGGTMNSIMNNSSNIFRYYMMGNIFLGLGMMLISLFTKVGSFLYNSLASNHIQNAVNTTTSAFNNKQEYVNWYKSMVSHGGSAKDWVINNIGANEEIVGQRFDRMTIMPDGTTNTGPIPMTIPVGSRIGGQGFDAGVNNGSYNISVALRYIAIAAAVATVIIVLYKKVKRANDKAKMKRMAQQTNKDIQEVTIQMIMDSNESDKLYYDQMQVIDEGVSDFLKSIAPTPTNLIKLVNKGIIANIGLSKSIEEGLKMNSISPLFAKFANFFVALGNALLIVSKGILLTLFMFTKKAKHLESGGIDIKSA